MSEVLNPVDIEQQIRTLANRLSNGVTVVTRSLGEYKTALRDYEVEEAKAYMRHQGPAHEKKYAAVIATESFRKAADDAEVVWRHADRTARGVESELSAFQSLYKGLVAMYGSTR
ncbi:hypothetical protein [Subtercola vilae]|uniref:Uncharacterized protein n=1 Tax=Subtercola vilae TaxID=2056433 RepID=A0A4T2B5D1_9MICO|nr:hypothetical protein [Subtercola vilae]TIH26073.1 hypothetical protein D4765_19025 [Subtercola vilae]